MQISHYSPNKIEKEVFLNEEDPEDDECLVDPVRQAVSDGSRDLRHLILKTRIVRGRPHEIQGDRSTARTTVSKTVYLGSNPSRPATKLGKKSFLIFIKKYVIIFM